MTHRFTTAFVAAVAALSAGCSRDLGVPAQVAPQLTKVAITPNPAKAGDVIVADWEVSAPPLKCEAVFGPFFSQCTIVAPRGCHCQALVPASIQESVYAAILSAQAEGGETRVFEPLGVDQNPPVLSTGDVTFTQDASSFSVSAPAYAISDPISGVAAIRFYGSQWDPTPIGSTTPQADGSIPLLTFSGEPPGELWIEVVDGVGHSQRRRAGNVIVTAGLAGRTRFRSSPAQLAPYFFDADGAPTGFWPGTGAIAMGEAPAAIAVGAAQVDDGVQAVTTAVFEPANVVSLAFTPRSVASTPLAQGLVPTQSSLQTAYDPVRRRTVLFGGLKPPPPACYSTGCPIDQVHPLETWEFDGDAWTSVLVPGGPSPRMGTTLAYDAGRGRVVLFGGAQAPANGVNVHLGDTWEWDGQSWTSIATPHGPTPRVYARLVYDPARGRMILHGGYDGTSNCDGGFQPYCTGTWEYDGHDWTLLTDLAPSPSRLQSVAAWNAADGGVLLFGGTIPGSDVGDYWKFDVAWSKYTPSAMIQAAPVAGCYDVARRVYQTITLEFSEYTLRELAASSTPLLMGSTVPAALFYDAARRVTYSFGDATQMYVVDQRKPHARYAVQTFALDVASGATLGSLAIRYSGFGSGAAGDGLALHAWNWATGSWDLVGANTAAAGATTAAKTISASPPGPIAQYLDPRAPRIWLMASAPASSATTESRVTTDYIGVQASYTLP
jgi:hypothetical protein